MDAWVKKKNKAMEELMNVTVRLLEHIQRGELKPIDEILMRREELIDILEACDRKQNGKTQPLDATWASQFEKIVQTNTQAFQILADHRYLVGREIRFLG